MTGFLADSSVGMAWAIPSQSSADTDGLLNEIAAGRSLVVPSLWFLEIANALIVLVRRGRIQSADCSRARQILDRLRPIVDDEGPRLASTTVSALAETHKLTVYDAVYLEAASRRGLPLATRDAALNKAAQRAGVSVVF